MACRAGTRWRLVSVTTRTNSARGLDSGPEDGRDWRLDGACRNNDPDLWTSPNASERGHAIWICQRRCPVRAACWQWANQHRDAVDQAVYGGIYWTRGAKDVGGHDSTAPVRPAGIQPVARRPGPVRARAVAAVRTPQASLLPHLDTIRELVGDGTGNAELADRYGTSVESMKNFLSRHGITRPAPCGTPAGYFRHLRTREKPCGPCGEANRRHLAEVASERVS